MCVEILVDYEHEISLHKGNKDVIKSKKIETFVNVHAMFILLFSIFETIEFFAINIKLPIMMLASKNFTAAKKSYLQWGST